MKTSTSEMTRVLAGLKEEDPGGDILSVRQAVFRNYREFRELMDKGYTREQICNRLRESMGINISYVTFCNYLAHAKRLHGE